MRKQKTFFVLDTTKCSGCNKEFYHVIIHPDVPNSQWCMMCVGERYGVEKPCVISLSNTPLE